MDPAQIRVTQGAGPGSGAVQVDPVGLVRLQGHRNPVAVPRIVDLARRRAADLHRTARSGPSREIVRDLRHRQRVCAFRVSMGAGRHVVDAGLGRREKHPAVATRAAVVVRRAGEENAVGIVDPVQIRVTQGAAPGMPALQVDPVGPARLQRHREPVAVVEDFDFAPDRPSDRNPAGGADPGPVIVRDAGRDFRHRQPVGAMTLVRVYEPVYVTSRHIVGAALRRREYHRVGRRNFVVVEDADAVRVVDPLHIRVGQGAGACRSTLQVDPVGTPPQEFDGEPVDVGPFLDYPRRRATHLDRAGRGGRGREIVDEFLHRQRVGACIA